MLDRIFLKFRIHIVFLRDVEELMFLRINHFNQIKGVTMWGIFINPV